MRPSWLRPYFSQKTHCGRKNKPSTFAWWPLSQTTRSGRKINKPRSVAWWPLNQQRYQNKRTNKSWCSQSPLKQVNSETNLAVNSSQPTIITPVVQQGMYQTIFIGYINDQRYFSTVTNTQASCSQQTAEKKEKKEKRQGAIQNSRKKNFQGS